MVTPNADLGGCSGAKMHQTGLEMGHVTCTGCQVTLWSSLLPSSSKFDTPKLHPAVKEVGNFPQLMLFAPIFFSAEGMNQIV